MQARHSEGCRKMPTILARRAVGAQDRAAQRVAALRRGPTNNQRDAARQLVPDRGTDLALDLVVPGDLGGRQHLAELRHVGLAQGDLVRVDVEHLVEQLLRHVVGHGALVVDVGIALDGLEHARVQLRNFLLVGLVDGPERSGFLLRQLHVGRDEKLLVRADLLPDDRHVVGRAVGRLVLGKRDGARQQRGSCSSGK
jgi:hypothetical protein